MRLVGCKYQVAMCSLHVFVQTHTPTVSVSRLPFTVEIELCENQASTPVSDSAHSVDRQISMRQFVSTAFYISMNVILRHLPQSSGSQLNPASGSKEPRQENRPSSNTYGIQMRGRSAITTS